ncbi:MAG: thiamine phosphate synthase [Alistipes sp.]|nr:thiamine phosphate synthase [Alistipes sp.]
MKLIAITQPFAIDREDVIIRHLLANGFDIVHLRKPDAEIDYCRTLLEQLTPAERSRIVVHDYAPLYEEYALRGIHLNRNFTVYPTDYSGTRSRSCHTFEEVARYKDECDYIFLSPIFDSISKQGYLSKFNHEELLRASREGIIDTRVIALGGVTPERIEYLKSLHFGGAAMMGAIYNFQIYNK